MEQPQGPAGQVRVACFATQGTGHPDHERVTTLLAPLVPAQWPFDRGSKVHSAFRIVVRGIRERPQFVVMEGTGLAGGIAVMLLRLTRSTRYVVSTGDAVGPFLAQRHRALAPFAHVYERLLYRLAAGVIGWTPFLVGRAFTLGARRAMCAANWAPEATGSAAGGSVRERLGIAESDLVFGIVGSLDWNRRHRYCYGAELVQAALLAGRSDLRVLIVGDGTGRARLEQMAGDALGGLVMMPGSVERSEVGAYLRALDVASLPQSVDEVGALRYSTKLSEYLAAGLPIVTGELPLAYELGEGWLWRLPGDAPWDRRYVDALAALLRTVTRDDVRRHRDGVPGELPAFDRDRQVGQVVAFLQDLARS